MAETAPQYPEPHFYSREFKLEAVRSRSRGVETPLITTEGPAIGQYLMGTIRLIHLVTAFIFTTSVLFRIYWAFAGSKYARWSQFLPATRLRWRDLVRMVRYYTFTRRNPPAEIGHNPLAGVTYMGVFVLFIVQIVTGFALYSLPYQDGWIKVGFGWVIILFGVQPVRLVHFLLMFLLIAFTIHHVYSAVLIDSEEQSGMISSMITGRKSLTARHIAEAQESDDPVRQVEQAPRSALEQPGG